MGDLPAILKIPDKIKERILIMSDPFTVDTMSQSCSYFRDLIHRPADQYVWRTLFLAKFDDPRSTFSIYGGDPKKYPWSTELKRRIHSETLLTSQKPFESLSHENQKLVLQILTDVICNSSSPSNLENSQDLVWVAQLINESDIFKVSGTADIMELLAQLHVYYGLTHEEKQMPSARAIRTASRCFVYDLRNYKEENVWGHFRLDQAGKVSWVHIDHIINVITMNLDDVPHLPGWMRPPTGLKAVRLYSAPAVETSMIDWAGVEGSWYRYVCFMDYRLAFPPLTCFRTFQLPMAIYQRSVW